MNYLLLIFFGLLPSIIWLLYFLRKDVHPESNPQVIKIFLLGLLAVLPAAGIEWGLLQSLNFFNPSLLKEIISAFLAVAFIEEFLKYLVIKGKILASAEFDEPIDLPLYMIIAALGFAALENIIAIVPFFFSSMEMALATIAGRFVSATFLHALASGTLGVFLAWGINQPKYKDWLLFFGFFVVTGLHGLYNFSIMKVEGFLKYLLPLIILIILALFLSFGLRSLKKTKSICRPLI